MSRIKMPTRDEILYLAQVRADMCLSVYLATSPMKMYREECRIELGNLLREAKNRLEEAGHDKRRIAQLAEQVDSLVADEEFCQYQANSLAILATPEMVRVYRLANLLSTQLEVADCFYLKPLFRALTFDHSAYILALSENEVKLIELFPDSDPEVLHVPDLPKDASAALGRSSMTSDLNTLDGSGSQGRKQRLARYSRIVDQSVKGVMQHCDTPLILIAAEPLASIYRAESEACLVDEPLHASPDKIPDHELVEMARPVLDRYYEKQLEDIKKLFDLRAGEERMVTHIADVAKAATYGMVDLAMVDFDYQVSGTIDEDGNVEYSDGPDSYGLIDEIVKRAMESGAAIMAVRRDDMIGDSGIAAVLRYPLTVTA